MRPVMILAGGTGGHVFPALAVANKLHDRGVPIIWVGTEKGIESRVVPAAGFQLLTMRVQGLRRKGFMQYVRAPIIILQALIESLKIIVTHKPCVLLGMGGFVAGPCALVGVLLRKPLVIHEQNSILGLTNRILAPICNKMFTGFPILKDKKKVEYSGNPVRESLTTISIPEVRLKDRTSAKRILVIGGSLGAMALNKIIPQAIEKISSTMQVEVWHQTGKDRNKEVLNNYLKFTEDARVNEFIDDMSEAYQWADLIICRSGAITLAEVATVGLGAVLIPYPYAVDDHQTANARNFVSAGAAYLVSESDLNPYNLAELLISLLDNPKQLLAMSCAAKKLSAENASQRIADECIRLGGLQTAIGAA
ncbi:MAG: undecaprenyldiphospho-muramoylpentapeptide beta-N-acetylglucosaminyltransferase [Pseudomonadota bacterium]